MYNQDSDVYEGMPTKGKGKSPLTAGPKGGVNFDVEGGYDDAKSQGAKSQAQSLMGTLVSVCS